MITYILQTIAFQLVFLALYEFLLKKETFFQWNRTYLLATPVISLILPFIKIGALQTTFPQNFIVTLPETTLGTTTEAVQNNLAATNPALSLFEIIFFTGMAISAMLLLLKLYKINQLKRKGKSETFKNTTLVHLPNSTDAFSFAGTIYLGENLNPHNKEYIIAHELVHTNQKHYLDLFYFELLRIVFWFNPLVYLYQKRIASLHEYIADAEVVAQSNQTAYYQNLLSEVFQTHTISFVNTFFNQSLIKKRIVMLHKSKSKKVGLLRYFLLVPILSGILFYTSCTTEIESVESSDNSITQKIEELKYALENNPDGLTTSEQDELRKLVNNATLKNILQQNTIEALQNQDIDELPYSVIENVPIYPGCENLLTNEEHRHCLSEKLNNLIVENFDTSVAKNSGLTGKQRIGVRFKIDTQGNVVDIKSRTPNKIVEEELKRVMALIPRMQPGMNNGKATATTYALPIVFEIKE